MAIRRKAFPQQEGNAGVELPKNLVEKAGFSEEDVLDIGIENGKIVLKPKEKER
ncbi:hypothetical protein MJ3_07273 [Salimicrobium jeotgali]|uniref:SpoVT-AbrB domain-containing protein n=1 Tax=Salimicrobium jeotgali TaxID=1230341 RepID=K2GB72_9BACI|nr:AbrB/MazE/SpoVT family DNA-binding domain-containing protein [Salimicrobium jeotgali]EKE31562.1 hypothetical protein MJ3_07273 [Salimicrobium jeotgali]MBM7696381.1 antitoxin component of MazEF toxin-antitoxin module [Salimicrobium jeotgali]